MADTESPPFSRLFVLGDREITDQEYEDEFSKFGPIQYIKRVKDKNTGEPKGFVYIKMVRTSSAALAVEKMNGEVMPEHTRPLKVIFASSNKSSENQTDEEIFAQLCRLFLTIPKSYTEEQIRDMFEKHGQVTKVVVVKDKQTGDSKGLCYVTFKRAYEAALAYESCDKDFKAKFADPISRKRQHEEDRDRDGRRSGNMRQDMSRPNASGALDSLSAYPHQNMQDLKVRVPKGLTEMQLTRLFNLVPTLEYCRHVTNTYSATDNAMVRYSNPSCAAYAKDAFQGFEYPPGCPLDCEYDYEAGNANYYQSTMGSWPNNPGMVSQQPMQVTSGAGFGGNTGYINSANSTPQLNPNMEMKKRLFIVCQPNRVAPNILIERLAKFGNLICFNYINGKNCGFIKYGSVESADTAQQHMNGVMIGENRLKVVEAEEPPDSKRKRRDS